MYEIQEADGVPVGTKIVVYLKTDCREFSDDDTVKSMNILLVKLIPNPVLFYKFTDYIYVLLLRYYKEV